MSALPVVTDDTFQAQVLDADLPVVLYFWAPWCGPCRMVGPVLEELATQYEGRVTILKINADENPRVTGDHGIVSLPTLNLYTGGELVRSVSGARPKALYAQEIDAVVGIDA